MFLLKDRRLGQEYFVFTHTDPRDEGFRGEVVAGAELDYDNDIHHWPDGEPRPQPQLGRDPANPKRFKVFKFPEQLRAAGFERVYDNTPLVVPSWQYYSTLFPTPAALAQTLGQDEWAEYLDEIDEATRQRRTKDEPEPPPGSDRDAIAEWIAKRHLGADGSIRQVVYLPAGAPPNEIRLVEVNERIVRAEDAPEPLDFGVTIAGRAMKVLVADVSKSQLERLKANPSSLPNGWAWGGERTWGLRA